MIWREGVPYGYVQGKGAGLYAGGGNAVHSEQDLRGVPSQKMTPRAVCPNL